MGLKSVPKAALSEGGGPRSGSEGVQFCIDMRFFTAPFHRKIPTGKTYPNMV